MTFEAGEDLDKGDAVRIVDGKVFKVVGEVVKGMHGDPAAAIMDIDAEDIENDDTRDFKESDVSSGRDETDDYDDYEDENDEDNI